MPQNLWKKLLETKKNQWVILLLVGVLLVVIAIPTTSGSNNDIVHTETGRTTTEMEERLEYILSQMQGIGDVHVMITYREDAQAEGVVVVAKGGGNAVVVQQITETVRALFDLDAHKIRVIESK